jgi:mono/diheme cytochrome c family protein
MRRSLIGIALISLFAGSSLLALQTRTQSVSDGVYTAEQAARGQALYTKRCASCHAPNLAGRAGPALTGDDFLANWNIQPLLALAYKVGTMPKEDSPRLTPEEVADLTAYLLQASKFPSGRSELKMDEAALKQVTFPAPAAKPAAAPTQVAALPAAGNVAAVMRGILFPSANIIFTTQSIDPGAKKEQKDDKDKAVGFDWLIWGGDIYKGWDVVDYASVAVAESAQLMLTPGRKCENGVAVPVNDPEWIKYAMELADAGKAAYKASQTRKQDVISEATNQLNDSCQHCHNVYRGRTHCAKR